MSISKEERERYRSWLPTMPAFEAEVLESLLDALDEKDAEIQSLTAEKARMARAVEDLRKEVEKLTGRKI